MVCVVAALACLGINGLGLLRGLARGNHDDKTLLYATSALRPDNVEALFALRDALPAIVESCPDARCRERTATRVSTLANYLGVSAAIRLARAAVDEQEERFCRRVSLGFYTGILLLHGAVYLLFVLLVATDRSPQQTFSVLALLMLLPVALKVPYLRAVSLVEIASDLLPSTRIEYGSTAYAPRGALALVFLLQVAAFASGRYRAWIGLTLLAPLVHAAQALAFAGVFAVALVLEAVALPEQRRRALQLLLFVAALHGAVALAAFTLASPQGAGVPAVAIDWLRIVKPRDVVWLAAAGALVWLVHRRRGERRNAPAVLLWASFLIVLAAVDVAGAVLTARGRFLGAQIFPRFFGGSSFVLGMLPWLGAALVTRSLVAAVGRQRSKPRLVTVVACLVLLVASTAFLEARDTAARAWRMSAWNLNRAASDLCRATKCSDVGCSFRGFRAMRPGHEPVFHLQLFDLLRYWEPYRDAMRRYAAPTAPSAPTPAGARAARATAARERD